MEETILIEAKRLSIEYFGKETLQSIFFSNMLRTHAEHYCEDFLGENDFCHKFAIWQADYGFGENKEEISSLVFSHENDIPWVLASEIYKKHNKWFTEVRVPELSKPIDFTEEDENDPFVSLSNLIKEEKSGK